MAGPPGPQQIRLREHQLFLALAILVGIIAGLAAVLFALMIDRAARLFFGLEPSAARLFLVPTAVSILTGILLAKVFPDVRGSGIPQTEAAFHLHGGMIPLRVPLGKFLTGVLCIGSGHSMGREGPSVQIGAGIASAIGRWFRLPAARLKELVPVGAAGALSAAFNTPVAAVLFALEEIMGDMNAKLLGSTVVASVASVIVARSLLGNEPLFRVPTYELVHPAELLGYAALGVVGGVLSLLFCKGLLATRRMFLNLPRRTRMWQPAVGGAAIGALLLVRPEVMGVGYDYVDRALNGDLVFRTLVVLALVKIVATIVSYSSGNAGGIFGPTLFMGAMAGGAVGFVVRGIAPFPTGEPGAYALVGMGTLFAGIVRAPMTSVFMIFEITQDYQILVPLMVANLLSFAISRRYQPVPVYHALLRQDEVHLPQPALRENGGWTAAEIMNRDVSFVAADRPLGDLAASAGDRRGWLVGSRDDLRGVVTARRLRQALEAGWGASAVESLLGGSFVHAHPDHPLDIVLERLAASDGVLPVVSRARVRTVEGVIAVADVTRFVELRAADRRLHDEGPTA